MKYFPVSQVKAGIEILGEKIILAQVIKKADLCYVQHLSNVIVAPNVIKPLFKKENILDEKVFIRTVIYEGKVNPCS